MLLDLGDVTLTIAAEMQSRMSITQRQEPQRNIHTTIQNESLNLKSSVDFFSRKERKERIGMTQKTNCCLKWRVEPSHPNAEEKAPALLYAQISFFAIFAFFAAKILRRGSYTTGI